MDLLARGTFDRIMFAAITGINPKAGTVSIIFLDQFGIRDDVPIPVVAMSQNAFVRFMPQVNDIVHVGIRGDESAVILGWHPLKYNRRVEAFQSDADSAVGGPGPEMLPELQPGEIDMRSSGGSYMKLDRIGDVLILSVSGRIHMQGKEGFTEVSQKAFKLTDGVSWHRFGTPYRLFSGISERELPASGEGAPFAGSSGLRENDLRLFDANGNPLFQESMGDVVDPDGVFELSGTSGGGASQRFSASRFLSNIGAAATIFSVRPPADIRKAINSIVANITDHVKETANDYVRSVSSALSTVIGGPGSNVALGNLSVYIANVKGIVNGLGSLAQDAINGLGARGKELRYRKVAFKNGEQVAAIDIDEDGGTVISSQSVEGINVNANIGSITLFALKSIKQIATSILNNARDIGYTAVNNISITAGNVAQIVADKIIENAENILRTSNTQILDSSSGTIKFQLVDGTGTPTGTEISITGGIVTVSSGFGFSTVVVDPLSTTVTAGPSTIIVTAASISIAAPIITLN